MAGRPRGDRPRRAMNDTTHGGSASAVHSSLASAVTNWPNDRDHLPLAKAGRKAYHGVVTYRKLFEKQLGGKKQVDSLSRQWQRHIDRIDSLPRPKKKLNIDKMLE